MVGGAEFVGAVDVGVDGETGVAGGVSVGEVGGVFGVDGVVDE